MILTIIILAIFLLISFFVIYNLFSQVKSLEKEMNNGFIYEDNYLKYYEVILGLLISAKIEMERIDHRGAFAKDDEVGFAFKALQTCIDNLVLEIKRIQGGTEPEENK